MERYQRVKKIGEGSFGMALLVRHKESGKQFVIKEINMSKMGRKERDEARKETAVLAQLQHPNIVTYKESFEEIGNLYIVMDYCDAGDLYGRINKQRGVLLQEEQIIDWFVQTCLAIKHCHDRKILHRDIKSQNIFLTRHGIVKLGDFGIAKVLSSTVELARTCIGTPYYLSPEICENKPYNNKSDIWSLGCVLYELTTLKHAFEAGNMKNLVLKIIRGSYPPPAPRYSYELRSLINALFKRSPRDRPSINTVLRKPLLTSRIKKFLSESEMAEEFSHTVMHGVKLKKVLPPGGGGRPLPLKPVVAKVSSRPPSAAGARYDPSSVYGQPVGRRSKDPVRKSADVRKSGGAKRPSSGSADKATANNELVRRRQELVERERKRKEEDRRKEDNYSRAHRELVEKQKQQRIVKAREEGWRSCMDSLGSSDSEKSFERKSATPSPKIDVKPAAAKGNYDEYNAFLDKLSAERKANQPPAARAVSARDRPSAGGDAPGINAFDPIGAAMRGQQAGFRGAQAAEQARVISEFHKKSEAKASYVEDQQRLLNEFQVRKQAAAAYKARAQGDLFGVGARAAISPAPYRAPAPKPSVGAPKPSARPAPRPSERPSYPQSARGSGSDKVVVPARPLSAREREEQEYLSRLKQIRLQNFNDRRQVKDNNVAPKPYDPRTDAEARKKKIEALRAQADERAKKLKADLERKRMEAYDKEKKLLVAAKARAKPAMPITQALNAIGVDNGPPRVAPKPEKCVVGMTAAMDAIGASIDEEKQKQKEQILKRLNAKPVTANKPTVAPKPTPAPKPAASDSEEKQRSKWGQPPTEPVVAVERPKWGGGGQKTALGQMSLEETGSHMDATQSGEIVVRPGNDVTEEEMVSARKQWGGKPSGTVLNALQNVGLSETVTSDSSESSVVSLNKPVAGGTITIAKPSPGVKAPTIGSTVTIVKTPGGGTVALKKAKTPGEQNVQDDTDAPKNHAPDNEAKTQDDQPKIEPQTDQVVTPSDSSKLETEETTEKSELEKLEKDSPKSRKSRSPSPSPVTPKSSPGTKKSLSPVSAKPNSPKSPASPKAGSPNVKAKSPTKSHKAKVHEPEIQVAVPVDTFDMRDSGDKSPLFNKVELDDTALDTPQPDSMRVQDIDSDEDTRHHKLSTLPRPKENLLLGLTTGNFDIADVNLLRTCSEPDLFKLFRTNLVENPFYTEEEVAASVAVMATHDGLSEGEIEEDVDEETQVLDQYEKVINDEGEESGEKSDDKEKDVKFYGDEDDEEAGDMGYSVTDMTGLIGSDDDDEHDSKQDEDNDEDKNNDDESDETASDSGESEEADMETLRQSMMSILNQSSISDDETVTKKKTKQKVSKARKKRREKKNAAEMKPLVQRTDSETSEGSCGRAWSARSVEDFQTMRDNMLSIVQAGTSKLTPVKEVTTHKDGGVTADSTAPSLNPDTEVWQSDGEVDDDYWEEEDMFSRLEATRENLERELGCDVFMKAYKTVQAIHEDEDEQMEAGVRLVTEILGPAKAHHYPSILQLVMADGVWTEDND